MTEGRGAKRTRIGAARSGPVRLVAASAVGGLVGVLLLGGLPARAGQASVLNACWSSFEARYRDLTLTFTGDATAGDGTSVTLANVTASVNLPDFLPLGAYNTGALAVGQNSIPAIVSFAILGDGTTEGTQVVNTEVTATTTITDPDGSPGTGDETATPIAATATFPNTTWTRPGATDPVSFRQAGPNTLPPVNRPDGTRIYAPTGSLFFSAVLPGQLRVSFDCRPGTTNLDDIKGPPTPGTADPFATLDGGGGSTTTVDGATTTVASQSTTTATSASSTTVVGASTTVPTSSGVVQIAATTTTTSRSSTTVAGSGSGAQTQTLPNTGLAVGLEALAGIVVADVGYLVWSSTHRGRKRP